MFHCFVDKIDEKIVVSGDDYNHIVNSLRAKIDDVIQISDQKNLYIGKIVDILPKSFVVSDLKLLKNFDKAINKTLISALIKNDKLDFLLMKATELGVDKIILVESDYSVVRLEANKINKKLDRWNTIVKMAAMQSRRITIPKIEYVKKFNSINYEQFDSVIMLDETSNNMFHLEEIKKFNNLAVVVGCEGGFSEQEHLYLKSIKHLNSYLLTDNILRSETASLAILSILCLV